ncbi:hypothetical protein Tco_0635816 [Tanacetum coccineum]
MTAKSRTVNNISYIDATVAGKPVTISKESIRSDLFFDDAYRIYSLNNQAIFDNIQLIGPSPSIDIPNSNPEGSSGNHGGQSSNDTSLLGKEDGLILQSVNKLKKGVKPLIIHHKAWMKSVALKTRLARKTSLKKKGVQKGYVSKQGRKSVKYFKNEPSVHKDPNFEDLDDFVDVDDTLDYTETEDDQNEGRTSFVVLKENESVDKEVSTEALVSLVKPNKGTNKKNEGTDKQDGCIDSTKVSTDRQGEGIADQNEGKCVTQITPITTSTPTPSIFGDDETIAQIDLKDKGKKMVKEEGESDTESDDITEAKKKFKMLDKDEEVAKKVQKEWEAKEEKKRLAEEESTKVALTNKYDFIQARINRLRLIQTTILAEELHKKNERSLPNEQRAKFVLYERLKRQDQNFFAIRSAKDERQIKKMNEESKDPEKKRLKMMVVMKRHSKGSTMVSRTSLRITLLSTELMGTSRHLKQSNVMWVLHIFDRHDWFHYMNLGDEARTPKSTPEDIEVEFLGRQRLDGNLTRENDAGCDFFETINKNGKKIVRWRLYEACGVCILELKDGTVIYMLVERKYPLSKELLQQMLDLGLEVEEESTAALQLVRFFKTTLNEEYVENGNEGSCVLAKQSHKQ